MSHLSVPVSRSPRLSPSPPPPSSLTTIDAAEERNICLEWLIAPIKRGDIYYVVDIAWFKSWCRYTGYNPDNPQEVGELGCARPGPIDNISLILDTPWLELKPNLQEHENYELVHSKVWHAWVSWYGVSRANNNPYNNDGHTMALPRQVVVRGLRQQETVEVYPKFFGIFYVDPKHPMEITPIAPQTTSNNLLSYQAGEGRWAYVFSQYSSLQDVLDIFSPIVTGPQPAGAPKPEGRVWRRIPQDSKDGKDDSPDDWKLISAADVTNNKIEFLEFINGTDLLLEWKNHEGKYQRTGQVVAGRAWGQFQINDEIDAKDTQQKWFESTIRDVKDGKIFVHFKGWSTRWDEWIPIGSDRIAPKNTYTSGPYEAKGDASSARLQRQNSVGAPPERGAVGLRNLGNTCFMNSTLQCLSNTPGLTEYFMDNKHLAELNRDNPLGWQGKVAEEYGLLINDIWSGQYRTVTPSGFKRVIGEFQPRFSGYQQHDSSELLSFLLDGLHEDLNRVLKKPATTAVESNGRPDAVVAAEAWERHLLRNQSVIVDLCQGQLKSRVVCPDCKKESITFDPFMFLSVPLPQAHHHRQSVTFIRMASSVNPHPQPATIYHLKLQKTSTIGDLRVALAKQASLPANYNLNGLLVVEIYDHKIVRFYQENQMTAWQSSDQIVVYDLPIFAEAWRKAREPGITPAEIKNTEIVVHKGACFVRDSKKLVPVGPQFLLPLKTIELQNMPTATLRKLVADAIAPYLRNGWHDGEHDHDIYQLHIANREGTQLLAPIPYDAPSVDLNAATAGHGYILAVVFNDIQRLYADPVDPEGQTDVPMKKGVDVYDCISAFSQEETLRQSEAWYCSNCKDHKCATKKFDLWRLPDVLIIHLKRFSYNKYFRDKIDTLVDFPVEGLDLHKWCTNVDEEKSSVYDLYAVSNHFGGLGGGHYTAYAKNLIDRRWYNLDDSSVSPILDVNRVKTAAAYVLFYHRRQPQQSSYSKSRTT